MYETGKLCKCNSNKCKKKSVSVVILKINQFYYVAFQSAVSACVEMGKRELGKESCCSCYIAGKSLLC